MKTYKMKTARELQKEIGYGYWCTFHPIIKRAKNLITNGLESGEILDTTLEVEIGSGAKRLIKDYFLDIQAEEVVKKLSSKKLGAYRVINNETSILTLLEKYCKYKHIPYSFQFRLGKYFYDFKYKNCLIEFDEPNHTLANQRKIDQQKNEKATSNGFQIFRFGLEDDIIDIIAAVDPND